MRRLIVAVILAACCVTAGIANGAVVPGREPTATAQAATNPNPFPPPPAAQPAPPATQPPTIVVPAPEVKIEAPKEGDFFKWLWAAIGTVFTAIFGAKTIGDWRGGKPDLKSIFQDPELRAKIDEQLGSLIKTGVPGGLIAQIPGVGAFEPLMRRLVLHLVDQRISELRGGIAPIIPDVDPVTTRPGHDLSDVFATLKKISDRLDQKTQ